MRLGERLQVLARLERRDREDVRRTEVGRGAVAVNTLLDAGRSDADPLRGDAEQLRHLVAP